MLSDCHRLPSESEAGSEDMSVSEANKKEAKKGRRPAAASKRSKKRKVSCLFRIYCLNRLPSSPQPWNNCAEASCSFLSIGRRHFDAKPKPG